MEYTPGGISLIDAGIMDIQRSSDPEGLLQIKEQMVKLVALFKPSVLSIEKLFFAKNRKTAIQVAQARGVILSTATEHGLDVREFGPNEIKLAITGYGLSDKKAVLKMVRLILREPELSLIDDASDALAVAIVACQRRIG